MATPETPDAAVESLVHALVERQVERTPDAIAVEHAGERLRYAELDARANQLAHHLSGLGVGPDDRVAICVERGPAMVVAILGVLKAGGAYVPLDPAYPDERLAYMLADSAPRALVVSQALRDRLDPACARIVIDQTPRAWADAPVHAPDRGAIALGPDHLAYVLYTSGSTGRPKGVAMPHGALVNLLCWQDAVLPGPARTLQFAALGFDVAFQEIFSTLIGGGTLVLLDEALRRDLPALAGWLDQQSIERLFLPYIALHALAELWSHRAAPRALRDVITAGEQLRITPAIRRLFDRSGGPRLHNHYGPTESHVVTACTLRGPPAGWPDLPPIGTAVDGCRIYVLDAHRDPVAPGATGEIWIGGAQLARGYLQAELTEERFADDPFAGGRMYRTGDLGRRRDDGELEYLGRDDFQVKIRGFRVELGEIEAQLARLPGVREAAVIAREDVPGDRRLVAYVAGEAGRDPAGLRGQLAGTLPDYMLPAAFVALDALPVTPNGKLDRNALPVPGGQAFGRRTYQATAGEIEGALAAIWSEVLGAPQIGRGDDFFQLGGHSLLAVRAIARVRAALSVELTLRDLFDSPTIEQLARMVECRRGDASMSVAPPITRVPRGTSDESAALLDEPTAHIPEAERIESSVGLTFAQQRLWFLDQLAPDSHAYHLPSAHRLRGRLDLEALRRAFEALIARHEALRTVFPASDGVARQDVLPAGRFELPVDDLTALPPDDCDRESARRAEAAALERFDLATGPLLRARVLRLSSDDHVLLLALHHIVADGWSLDVLWRELAALYSGFLDGESPELAPLPVQYIDYAAWLARWMTGDVLDRQLAYWTQQLAEPPVDLPLPYRDATPAGASDSAASGASTSAASTSAVGARINAALDAELTRGLHALAQRHGATLFMVLCAALRVLLARITGQRDLCIGTAIANRDRPEIEGLIGMFVNTLVLRGPVHPGERFADVLARERDLVLAAHAHAHAPFERVVDALGLPRDPDRMPLVQVMCVDQGEVTGEGALPGLTAEPFRIDLEIADFELTFDTRERGGIREVTVTYQVDRFERATVATLVERYLRLLAAITEPPQIPGSHEISEIAETAETSKTSETSKTPETCKTSKTLKTCDLPLAELARIALLSPAERAALFDEPARCIAWEPRGPGVIAQIARWMAQTPDAPAILWETGRFDYGALDARSSALAALLRHRGVGPDRTVAIVAERGALQIVGMIAALRAGGAYLPINPDLPAERVGWMLDEAAPVVILCDGPPPPALDRHASAIIRLDQPWPEPSWNPETYEVADAPHAHDAGDGSEVPPDALAYIIYTSGSTGRPKGVQITRRGFDAHLRWMQEQVPLASRDRVLQLAPAMFDTSVDEIFQTLMAGGALVLPRPGGELDPAYLAELSARHAVTAVSFVPSLLRVVVDACRHTPWPTVEHVICGGEALTLGLARDCRAVFPRAAVHNTYGPTETTVIATYWACHPDDASVPIGHPVGDTTAYVLDDELAPVPPGGVGQLWIGGVQLARGYLARPALTAERFRPNPFAARPGERIYQTGDLVRQRPDGVLDYLGRADFQVKLRGFRIELGEIEAALLDHPRVRAALVVVRDEQPGEPSSKLLVAYVCLADSARPEAATPAELQGLLAGRLPAYMIPSAFVVLGELPRTATGKLDRKALPAPSGDAYQRAAYAAPATPTEARVAAIWAEVLGSALGEAGRPGQLGRHDNFFALGGHSLLVIQLVSQIQRSFGIELSPRAVFEAPTVAGQAERILAGARSPESEDPAERELVAEVAALPDRELSAQLAEWASAVLEVPLASVASSLTGPRRALAERLIAQHRIDVRPSLPLARRASPTAPATFAQQLQWDYHQRGNFPTLGIHATAFAVRGPFDAQAMQQAVGDLVERQASLRTVFHLERGRLGHTTQDRGPWLDVVDLSGAPERAAHARRLFEAISRPHDLGREVFRAQLVRLGPDDHLLFLAPHHIVVDGFSWGVLDAELAAHYRARAAGHPAALAPLELACADFCLWQRSLEDRPAGRAQLAFWERSVAGYVGLELPGDRPAAPRGAVGMATDTYEAGSIPFGIDGPRWRAVERACVRLGCTPYVAVASGFLLLLSRWSGRDDVCTLSSNFHRNRPGSEAVIGNLITPYPLRAAFDERASLEDAVRHCHDRVLANREHAHVAPSSALAAWVEWSRYNVNYQIEAPGADTLDYGAARVTRLDWSALPQYTAHDLALFVRQNARGLTGELVYNAERFSPELAARAADRLGQLIDLIASDPAHRVGALPREP